MPLQEEQVVAIPGLSGEEIIVDLCEQIASRLRNDCNLRPSDSYVNGYSASVTVKISCYGIDTAEVETTMQTKLTPAVKTEGEETKTEVEAEVVVAHEPDLTAVRERSEQTAPDVEQKSQPAPDAKEGEGPARRRYGTTKPARVAGGGAGSFDENA